MALLHYFIDIFPKAYAEVQYVIQPDPLLALLFFL